MEGIAYLLQVGAFKKWKSQFEIEMLNVMLISVVRGHSPPFFFPADY